MRNDQMDIVTCETNGIYVFFKLLIVIIMSYINYMFFIY